MILFVKMHSTIGCKHHLNDDGIVFVSYKYLFYLVCSNTPHKQYVLYSCIVKLANPKHDWLVWIPWLFFPLKLCIYAENLHVMIFVIL